MRLARHKMRLYVVNGHGQVLELTKERVYIFKEKTTTIPVENRQCRVERKSAFEHICVPLYISI